MHYSLNTWVLNVESINFSFKIYQGLKIVGKITENQVRRKLNRIEYCGYVVWGHQEAAAAGGGGGGDGDVVLRLDRRPLIEQLNCEGKKLVLLQGGLSLSSSEFQTIKAFWGDYTYLAVACLICHQNLKGETCANKVSACS